MRHLPKRHGSSGQERPTPHRGGRISFDTGEGKWLWRCCICGVHGHWSEGWTWYGSVADWDAGEVRLVACPKHERALNVLLGVE